MSFHVQSNVVLKEVAYICLKEVPYKDLCPLLSFFCPLSYYRFLLYSTLLKSSQHRIMPPYSILLYPTLLTTPLYPTLPSSLLPPTLLIIPPLPYPTLPYVTLPYCTLLITPPYPLYNSLLPYPTLPCLTVPCLLLHPTPPSFTIPSHPPDCLLLPLPCPTLPYSTLLYPGLPYLTLLLTLYSYFAIPHLNSALPYSVFYFTFLLLLLISNLFLNRLHSWAGCGKD